MRIISTAGLLGLVVAGSAQAEPYIGGGVGSSRVNSGDFEGSDTGWKIFAGGSGGIFGGELGYVDFGELGGSNGPRARAWTPAVTLGFPIGASRIYGKAGVAFADVEGSSLRQEYKNEDPYYGLGARLGGPSGLGLRLEYERFRFDREDVDLASAALEFRFGAGSR